MNPDPKRKIGTTYVIHRLYEGYWQNVGTRPTEKGVQSAVREYDNALPERDKLKEGELLIVTWTGWNGRPAAIPMRASRNNLNLAIAK